MKIPIGIRYEETKTRLISQINRGNVSIQEEKPENHSCYFCGNPIEGKILILKLREIINNNELNSKYYIDNSCYTKARLFGYHDSFSLN